jgi:chromosome segregation ATPase
MWDFQEVVEQDHMVEPQESTDLIAAGQSECTSSNVITGKTESSSKAVTEQGPQMDLLSVILQTMQKEKKDREQNRLKDKQEQLEKERKQDESRLKDKQEQLEKERKQEESTLKEKQEQEECRLAEKAERQKEREEDRQRLEQVKEDIVRSTEAVTAQFRAELDSLNSKFSGPSRTRNW